MSEGAAADRAGAVWTPWALLALTAFFLATRLTHLMTLPVFLDEAIHLDWAFRTAATGQLTGLSDGGRYLPVWIYAVIAPGADDPLRAARLWSVACGLASVVGLAWLGRALGSARAGILAAFFYVASPFTLVYDRMALVDALLAALVLYALVFLVLWARGARRRFAVLTGLAIGAAGLTKLSGLLLLPLPALVALLSRGEARVGLRRQLAWVYGVVVVALLPLLLDTTATGRFFQENLWLLQTGPGGASYIGRNAGLAVAWLLAYFTPAGSVVILLCAAAALWRGARVDALLAAVAVGYCAFFVLAGGRYWFPRYVLPAVPPLFLLAARGAVRLGRPIPWIAAGVVIVVWAPFVAALLTDPARAPLPPVERSQYVYDWPAGYGVAEAAEVLRERAKAGSLALLRDRSSGSMKESLDLLLRRRRPALDIVDAHMRGGDFTDDIERLRAAGRPVLLAVDEAAEDRAVLSLDGRGVVPRSAAFVKPDARRRIALYDVSRASSGGAVLECGEAGTPSGATSEEPPEPRALHQAGVCLWMEAHRQEAVRLLAEALRLDPEDVRTAYALAVARNAVRREP